LQDWWDHGDQRNDLFFNDIAIVRGDDLLLFIILDTSTQERWLDNLPILSDKVFEEESSSLTDVERYLCLSNQSEQTWEKVWICPCVTLQLCFRYTSTWIHSYKRLPSFA
jgi:hypothetical protein